MSIENISLICVPFTLEPAPPAAFPDVDRCDESVRQITDMGWAGIAAC